MARSSLVLRACLALILACLANDARAVDIDDLSGSSDTEEAGSNYLDLLVGGVKWRQANVDLIRTAITSKNFGPVISSFRDHSSQIGLSNLLIGDSTGILASAEVGFAMDKNTLIASASKLLSAIIVYRLVEQGVLNLTTTPQQVIPWWTNDTADARSHMTVDQMMSMTTGFRSDAACLAWRETTGMSLEQCTRAVYDNMTAFAFAPADSTFDYGEMHFSILGLMAVLASKSPSWVDLARRELLAPIGLDGSLLDWPVSSAVHPMISGGAQLSSSTYGSILIGLANNRLLSASSQASLFRDRLHEGIVKARDPARELIQQDWHYAQGCWVECPAATWDASTCGGGVLGTYSSLGGLGFYPVVQRSNQNNATTLYWLVVGTNVGNTVASVVGIAVGVTVALLCLCASVIVGCVFYCRRKKKKAGSP